MNQDNYDRLTILLADATKALTEAAEIAKGYSFQVWGAVESARVDTEEATARLDRAKP